MSGFKTSLMLCMICSGSFMDFEVATDGPRTIYDSVIFFEAAATNPTAFIHLSTDLSKEAMTWANDEEPRLQR